MSIGKSMNAGVSWTYYNITSTPGVVHALAIHPTNSDIIFAGGNRSNYQGSKILKSIDRGIYWFDSSAGIPDNSNYVYAIVIDPITPDIMYAGCNRGIFKSSDGGTSWADLKAGFNNINAIIIDPLAPMTIYAGTSDDGVFISNDGGVTWTPINEGLTNLQIKCLALDVKNHLLFAGTDGGGVFRRDISTAIEPVIAQPILPTTLALKPNFPNPFNPNTTIVYEVPVDNTSPISFKFYNISGQLVKTIVDEYQPAGQYTVSWDGTDECGKPVSSGVYLYILKAGDYHNAQKMMLLR